MSAGRIRAFLAVNFPVPVVRRIADEVRAVAPAVRAAGLEVAWVPSANVHLTLKFLGSIDPLLVEGIRGALTRELRALAPIDVEARGLGAFPDARRPRILWAGVRAGSSALAALQQAVERWMEELGFAREERAFHPHLTVGRVKRGEGSIQALLGDRAELNFGGGRVEEVVLYESRTLKTGAEYAPLARVPLGEPVSGERRT